MIAQLPMYDWPELRDQHDRLWQRLGEALRDYLPTPYPVPERLSRSADPFKEWLSPELLLGQTCGLPFAQGLHERVSLLGSPCYQLDCEAGDYYSVLLLAPGLCVEDYTGLLAAGARVEPTKSGLHGVVNARDSQSGYSALLQSLPAGALTGLSLSGSHRRSIQLLAEGQGEITSIDAVSWALAKRYEPAAQQLQVLGLSQPTPCLPWISAQAQHRQAITNAVQQTLQSLGSDVKESLLLAGFRLRQTHQYLYLAPRLLQNEQKHNAIDLFAKGTLLVG